VPGPHQGALFRATIRFPQQLGLEHHLPCHRVIDVASGEWSGSSRGLMNLPLSRNHRRQHLMKRRISLLRAEPLRRSGPVQFAMRLIEDFAKLPRQRDHLFAVHIVDQREPFNRNATVLGLDGEIDCLSGVSGGGHRTRRLSPRPETKLSQIKEAQFLDDSASSA